LASNTILETWQLALTFYIVMQAISREFRVDLPWKLLHADDLAVIAETEVELISER